MLRLKKRPNRYYMELIILSFVLVTLPVILLGYLSYAKSSDVVRQKVSDEKSLNLQQALLNVEQMLKVIDQVSTHFLGSSLMINAINEPLGPDQFQLFSQIKTELNHLQRLDTGISDIRLWSQPGNWFINNDGLYRLDAWQKSHPGKWMEEPPLPTFWSVSSNSPAPSPTAMPFSGKAAAPGNLLACSTNVNLIKKIPLTSYRSSGQAILQVPACHISKLITVNPDSEAVFIFDKNGQLIMRKGIDEQGIETPLRDALTSQTTKFGSFSIEVNQKKFTVNHRVSDYNDWIYVSVITWDQFIQESSEIGWFTVYICLGLLVLFVVFGLYWSKRLYRPIGKIVKDVIDGQNIAITGRRVDEMKLIGEQVHTLFRTNKQLESRLYGQTELLRTFFMIKLFLGGMKEEEVLEQLDAFQMRKDFSRFCVLAVQVGNLEHTRFSLKDIDLLLFAVNNIVGELLAAEIRLQPIVLGHNQLTVLTGSSEHRNEFMEEAYSATRLIQSTVSELLGLPILLGVSLSYEEYTDIPRAYEESVEALKRQPSFGGETIVRFADLGENHALHYAYPYMLQSELFDAIKLADRDQAQHLLRQMIETICSNHPNPYDLQFNAIRLLMNMLGLANGTAGQAISMQRQQSLFDELFNLNIADEGEAWFKEKIIDPLMEAIEELTEVRHLSIAKQLVQLIHEKYDTDLTIELCADQLHYNSSYISTIFRKSMDISFSGYLSQYRHQIALKWLKETEMPIKDIAERLRYNNSQNFIRSFRKVEGISPGKYRELEPNG